MIRNHSLFWSVGQNQWKGSISVQWMRKRFFGWCQIGIAVHTEKPFECAQCGERCSGCKNFKTTWESIKHKRMWANVNCVSLKLPMLEIWRGMSNILQWNQRSQNLSTHATWRCIWKKVPKLLDVHNVMISLKGKILVKSCHVRIYLRLRGSTGNLGASNLDISVNSIAQGASEV